MSHFRLAKFYDFGTYRSFFVFIDPQNEITLASLLYQALMHAAVFGNVTAIIQRMYGRRATFQAKTKDLKDFMRMHHIPKPLKQRIQEFFQTMWSMNHGINIEEVSVSSIDGMR